jgi:quercetin dioxygenase-like cupin family protein
MTYDFSIIRHMRKKMGLTIYGLSEKCGVSYVALSKLERNLGNPELKTLDKIARSLDIETHNLLALAEHERPRIVDATQHVDHGFDFNTASIGGVHVSLVKTSKGTSGAGDHSHRDDYEIAFVLSGKVVLTVKNSEYEINAGQAVRFDCLFEHNYETIEDTTMIHVLIAKQMGREPTPFPPITNPAEKAARKKKR